MPKANRASKANKANKAKNKPSKSKNGNPRASFTLNAHVISEFSTPISGLSQITIASSLSEFPRAMGLYNSFQTYKIIRCEYRLIPRYNISSQPGAFPVMLRVPITSSDLPVATVAAYSGYDKL